MDHRKWTVQRPRVIEAQGGVNRAVFCVDDQEFFVESRTPLRATTEAALQAFLFPAMRRRVGLHSGDKVCPLWKESYDACRRLAREWWSFRGGDLDCEAAQAPSTAKAAGRGLFFGGGVDSMYSLKTELQSLTHLVYVEGFDIPLEDQSRLERVAAINEQVARECGLELITLRTNLRSHPAFRKLSWSNTFGGALAAIGHLLQDTCSELLIPDDGQLNWIRRRCLGIHKDLVPLWSFPQVSFVHHDSRTSRKDKAKAIAGWPIAHKYLRVCWEHRDLELNCGVCEKCLRTRLGLLAAGGLDRFETFTDTSIAHTLSGVRYLSSNLSLYYKDLLPEISDPEIRQAIEALFTRSRWRWPIKNFGVHVSEVVKQLRYRYT